ncbi:unnamed protein product, partial [marine sediment metagenome]
TSKNDTWYFTVRPLDGGTTFGNLTSSEIDPGYVTIRNTPPVTQTPSFVDLVISSNEDLTASWGYSDYDGDIQNSSLVNITWYRNGTYQAGYNNYTTLFATALTKHDNWNYIIPNSDN